MSIDSENNISPTKPSRLKWIIGCGVAAVVFLCVVIFIVLGGLVGISQFLGGDPAEFTVEVVPPTVLVIAEEEFTFSVVLTNTGNKNITITELQLPEQLADLATLISFNPADEIVRKDDQSNHYQLNLLIAPMGQETLEFTFRAVNSGEIRSHVTGYAGEQSTTSAMEINIAPIVSSSDISDVQTPVSPVEESSLEGEILLFDEFNDNTQNWEVGEFDGASVDINDGQMVMDVFTDNLWAYSILLDNLYENVNLAVDIEVIDPEDDGNFGFVCMFQDEGNFIALQIKQDGYFTIWGFDQYNYVILVDWTYSEAIVLRDMYALSAYCGPDSLALYLDGTLLVETVPRNDRVGKIGLIAGTYDTYPLIIGFDNFKVLNP